MAAPSILLTGATGFVGGELLRRLLRTRPDATIFCLIRARDPRRLSRRRAALLASARVAASDAGRVVAVPGRIEEPGLGLRGSGGELPARLSEVFHAAATTRFDLSLAAARRINLAGARHVVRLARQAGARLHYVSTAYVTGDPLEPGRYRNAYEQSKAEAEELVREARDLRATCYRPSIVVGDSRTGRTLHFRVLYEPMKWVYFGATRLLPCRPEVRVDVVPVDWVCDALVALSSRKDTVGRTLPLTAGVEGALSIGEIVQIAVETGRAYHAERGEVPPFEVPRLVSPEEPEGAALFPAAAELMRAHVPYMLTEQLFDPDATDRLLSGSGLERPGLADYLATIVRYGLERGFGSRRAA
ncbi:MAG: SDR family oxidoreductase [Myxococcota bacterium]